MADKVIGLDIGTNAIRAAEVALGPTPRLLRFGQVGLPHGAVHEAEVVDVAAVAAATRRLWKEAGFTRRRVRVGLASARVIVRAVDLPVLSDADTSSALGLQLADYVPLAPESTVFDFQPLETVTSEDGEQRRVLLAAAHRDAVRPLADAVARAGLKLDAIDVISAALARSVRSEQVQASQAALGPADPDLEQQAALLGTPEPAAGEGSASTTGAGPVGGPGTHTGDGVDAVVSIGAGTVVVVVTRASAPLFARTVTNVAGRRVTERIASELSLSAEDAERHKRGVPVGEEAADTPELALAAAPLASELVAEVVDSLAYYGGQAGSLPVRRVLLTGGGSLLEGLPELLEERLGLPATAADPLAGVDLGDLGFDPEDLPFLAPYLAAAFGVALGGGRRKAKRIDLSPREGGTTRSRRPLVAGGAAVVLLLGVGALYLQRGNALERERARSAVLEAAITESSAARPAGDWAANARTPAVLRGILEVARMRDADWQAVAEQLDVISLPLGVEVTSLQGSTDSAVDVDADEGGEAAPGTTEKANEQEVPPLELGRISLTATATGLDAVARWVDAVAADPRFEDPWVSNVTSAGPDAGAAQFSAEVRLTRANLVTRTLTEVSG